MTISDIDQLATEGRPSTRSLVMQDIACAITEDTVQRVRLMVGEGWEPRDALAEAIWYWHLTLWMTIEKAKAVLRADFPEVSPPRPWGGAS